MLTLAEIQARAYATAKAKGWHERPLRSVVIGQTIGSPAPGSQVYVTAAGDLPGRFCSEHTQDGNPTLCPGRTFGRPVLGGHEIVTIEHDRVLAKHALIHTELTEAHEAIADGFDALYIDDGKPEGLPAEIADVIVRICDTTAALGLTLPVMGGGDWLNRAKALRAAIEIQQASGKREQQETALLWLARVRQRVDRATEAARIDAWPYYTEQLAYAVVYSAAIVIGYGHDVAAAIKAKMDYNETRPHRHGGKQA